MLGIKRAFQSSGKLSRRDFLRLSGLALTGSLVRPAALRSAGLHSLLEDNQEIPVRQALLAAAQSNRLAATGLPQFTPYNQGRITDEYVDGRKEPSFDSERVSVLWRDSVIPITGIAVSEDTSSHNLIWYQSGENGYVHSGSVQPVRTQHYPAVKDIPEGGQLAEVTVPYTDARWSASPHDLVAYRFYFETTHWVIGMVEGKDGNPWYKVLDDKWEFVYYVPAVHLRLVPASELAPISAHIPNSLKRIVVYRPQQIMVAYEQGQPAFLARVATGAIFRDGNFTTPAGTYITFHKRPSRHMAAGNLAAGGYDLPGVPWISYITKSGIAFHGTYWHNNFGRPRSHGCINLSSQAARWVFLWTLPNVPPEEQMMYEDYGTTVEIIE